MASSLVRDVPPAPVWAPLPPENTLWVKASRTICKLGKVQSPGANATIVTVEGFRTWQQTDIYRIDWFAHYDATPNVLNDMAIFVNTQQLIQLPLPNVANTLFQGTLYIEAGDADVSVKSITGAAVNYTAALFLTRLLNGFRAG